MALNLNNLKTPGVYIDEVSLLPSSVAAVGTAIPAFIGYTEKSKTDDKNPPVPVRISNLLEYEEIFGLAQPEGNGLELSITQYTDKDGKVIRTDDIPVPKMDETKRSKHNMYYALSLYFANGGGPCYIVSVGEYSKNGETVKKDDFEKGLTALANEDEPTLIVIPEAVHLSEADHIATYQAALDQAAKLQDRFVIIDVKQDLAEPKINEDIAKFRGVTQNDKPQLTNNLKYGAAYYPYLNTTIDYLLKMPETGIMVKFKKIPEVGEPREVSVNLDTLKVSDNLLYNQLLNVLTQVGLTMPPSPAIAGIYAQTDASRGVHKAPANIGVVSVIGPTVKIDDGTQEVMNVDPTTGQSVNAIRTITGRGTVVWGARTLDGNNNEWRYIPVRRFFNFVEESVKKATYRFVFEPNDANTWVSARAMIENFLTLQWRQGALQGAKPEEAFKVEIGLGQTMTTDDILEGRMIIKIGMAVVRPSEFIILRFYHKMAEA